MISTRRQFLEASIVTATALLGAACSLSPSSPNTGGQTGTSASSQASDKPQRGGTLVTALTADPAGGSRNVANDGNTFTAFGPIYSALVSFDTSRAPRPDLAESWTLSPDEKTYTFKLRQGVKFHDGQPVTAADVKYTIQEVTGKFNAGFRPYADTISTIDTPDDHTVVFFLNQPLAVFLLLVAQQFTTILPKHLYDNGTDPRSNPVSRAPVGSGPFKFQQWINGEHITLVRNDDYYLADRPYLDRVVLQVIPDAGSRTIAFQHGDIDFLPSSLVAAGKEQDLASGSGVYVDRRGTPRQALLYMNTSKAPLQDVRLRRAIAMSIDPKTVIDKVYFGFGARAPTSHLESDLGVFHNPNVKLPAYDVAGANALLDQAGYPKAADGTRFELGVAFDGSFDQDRLMADVVTDSLAAIGVRGNKTPYDSSSIGKIVFGDGNFDLYMSSFRSNDDPALGMAPKYTTSAIGTVFANGSRYSNSEVDRLLSEGGSTTDTEKRKAAYWRVQEILAQDLPTWPLADLFGGDFYSSTLKGYATASLAYPFYRVQDIWQSK